MKNYRKLIAFLVAVSMVLSLCFSAVSVNADNTPDGKVTVRNATVGHTYTLFKIFDLTYETITVSPVPTDGSPKTKDLVSYTYTKTGATDAFYTALTSTTSTPASPFELAELDTNLYSVTIKDGKNAEDISNWLKANLTALTATDQKVADKSELVFSSLPYGYYFVTSSLGTIVTLDSTLKEVVVVDKNEIPSWDNYTPTPSVTPTATPEPTATPSGWTPTPTPTATPDPTPTPSGWTPTPDPTETPDGTPTPTPTPIPGWPTPASPTPTADLLGPGKVILENGEKVKENTVNLGDTVNFNIAINAKAYAPNAKGEYGLVTYYYITDELAPGFSNPTDIVVSIDGEELTVNTDYKIVTNGNKFDITILFGEKYGSSAKIEVTYKATLSNETSVVYGAEGNLNTANFTYSTDSNFDPSKPDFDPNDPTNPDNNPYDPTDPKDGDFPEPKDPTDPYDPDDVDSDPDNPGYDPDNEVKTKTYTYAIGLLKVDSSNNPVSGAHFKLVTENSKDSTAYFANLVKESDGIYKYVETVATGSTNAAEDLVVDSNGKLLIKGLKEGSYYLVETTAPAGYNINKTPIVANVAREDADTTTFADVVAFKSVFENKSGTELPETGGIGTTLFITFGLIAIIGAGIFLVTNKRISKEEI